MKSTVPPPALVRALRALAHPNRLAIFERIHRDEARRRPDRNGNTVCAIAADFRLALSTVSHHIKALRDAGLIRCERRGQRVLCTIDHATLDQVRALLDPRPRRAPAAARPAPARRPRGT